MKVTLNPSAASVERQIFADRRSSGTDRQTALSDAELAQEARGGDVTDGSLASITAREGRSRSMKSLRHLPRTTHIVSAPPISRSVPFLQSIHKLPMNVLKSVEC